MREVSVNIIRLCRSSPKLGLLLPLLFACPAIAAEAASAGEQRERASAVLEQAVKTDPNNAELWLHLGFAYRKTGQMDQAQSAFEKAASLDPRNRDALYMLGLIYEKKHQTQDALRVWKEYLAVETDASKRGVAEKHIHHLNQ
jgi:cytochrome c-type biogenesis protein CcmH/NrfG